MNRIKRYNEYYSEQLAIEFIDALESSINESDENNGDYKSVQEKIISDLKLNFRLIGSFGAGWIER